MGEKTDNSRGRYIPRPTDEPFAVKIFIKTKKSIRNDIQYIRRKF